MVVYRVDLLDEQGKVSISGSLSYPTDREVLRAAAKVIGHHRAVEVWDQTRVVGQLAAKDCERLNLRTARPKYNPRPAALPRTAMTG
jgi:hypothetical protein